MKIKKFYLLLIITLVCTKTNIFAKNSIDSRLIEIVSNNNVNDFHKYIKEKKKINVNQKDEKGKTLMHWAAIKGGTEIAYELLKIGADINVRDNKNNTPFHYLAEYGNLHMLKFLYDSSKFDIDNRGYKGLTMANIAAREGFLKILKFTNKHKADLNTYDNNGFTPLMYAARNGNTKMVKFLLKNNVNFNHKNNNGRTCLHCAVLKDHVEVTEALLQQGAKIDEVDNQFKSALHLAVFKNHIRTIKVLLKNKPNLNIEDNMGMTPFHYCASDDDKKPIFDLLIGHPSLNLDARDKWGRNALNLAIEKDQKKMIRILKKELKKIKKK